MGLNFSIDGILITAYGIVALIAGFKNKGAMFMIVGASGRYGKNYDRLLNFIFGTIFLVFGLTLLFKKN